MDLDRPPSPPNPGDPENSRKRLAGDDLSSPKITINDPTTTIPDIKTIYVHLPFSEAFKSSVSYSEDDKGPFIVQSMTT